MPDGTSLAEELKMLRRGRGLYASDLAVRVGPTLRLLAGVHPETTDVDSKQRLVEMLVAAISRLPASERLMLEGALAIHSDTRNIPILSGRITWLSRAVDRDARTVRRRLDRATGLLAEDLLNASRGGWRRAEGESGWYVRSLRSLVRLDSPAVVIYEDREIIATRDGIRKVIHRVSLPPVQGHAADQPRSLDIELDAGGTMHPVHESSTGSHYLITLGRALNMNEPTHVRLTVRMPLGQPMKNYYLCMPLRRTERFEVTVRFDQHRLPREIRRISHATAWAADAPEPAGESLAPDFAGEVRTEFSDLRIGFSYGIWWSEDTRRMWR